MRCKSFLTRDAVGGQFTFLGLLKGGENMRSEWIPKGEIVHILAALSPENRLACEVSLATGLRIGDVLALKPQILLKKRFTIREQKTGKTRVVYLPANLRARCFDIAGQHFIFEGRLDGRKARTRQAVYKDLRRAARAFRCEKHISPHSLRKAYAVEEYAKCGDLKKVQKLLNHSSEAVTLLYAMAHIVNKRRKKKG